MEYDATLVALVTISNTIPIEAYFHQIQHVLNSTLTKLSEHQKYHASLEFRVLDMHMNSSLKEDKQGEPSLVMKPYI